MKIKIFHSSTFSRKEKLLCLLIPVIMGIIVFFAWHKLEFFEKNPLDRFHYWLQEMLIKQRNNSKYYEKFMTKNRVSPIVLILIDDLSLKKLNLEWPIPRSMYCELIEKIEKYNPRVIGLDIIFAEKSPKAKNDKLLAETLNKYDNIILGSLKGDEKSFNRDLMILPNNILIGSWPLKKRTDNIGYVDSACEDSDGVIRTDKILFSSGSNTFYSFDALLLSKYLGVPLEKVKDYSKDGYQMIGDVRIPVKSGAMWINYVAKTSKRMSDAPGEGGASTSGFEASSSALFESLYLYEVVNEKDQNILTDVFKDKIVLLGVSAIGGEDIKNTPLGKIPGVEVHINILLTILFKEFFIESPLLLNFLLLLLPSIFLAIILPYVTPRGGSVITFILIYLIYQMIFFSFANYEITYKMDLFCFINLILTYLSVSIWHFIVTLRAKNRMKSLLLELAPMPEPVLQRIMDRYHGKVVMGGEKVELTVLFSDIRGYTNLSQNLDPKEVMDTLNEFYGAIGKVYKHNGGMVFDYMGDGQMIVFGADESSREQHAFMAVKAALEMRQELKHLNDHWESQGRKSIDIGIGINTGVVSLGFLGTGQRKQFSAIGDTTNVASRIESLTKTLNASIIISESTYEESKDLIETEPLPPTKVKGKDEALNIYKVIGLKEKDRVK